MFLCEFIKELIYSCANWIVNQLVSMNTLGVYKFQNVKPTASFKNDWHEIQQFLFSPELREWWHENVARRKSEGFKDASDTRVVRYVSKICI